MYYIDGQFKGENIDVSHIQYLNKYKCILVMTSTLNLTKEDNQRIYQLYNSIVSGPKVGLK